MLENEINLFKFGKTSKILRECVNTINIKKNVYLLNLMLYAEITLNLKMQR